MSQVDPKILELEKQVKFLQEQVSRILTQVQYLERERVRAKSELSQVASEMKSRKNQ